MSAEAFVDLFRSDPASLFVSNLETQVTSVVLGDRTIPCTINVGTPTCYICCPTSAYVDYARAELKGLGVPRLAEAATAPLLALGRILVGLAGLDRQVQPNNWLLATNPAPQVAAQDLDRLLKRCVAAHPGHVVYWRSLNMGVDGDLLATMRRTGWTLLPARLVYLFDGRTTPPRIGRDESRDRSLLKTGGYGLVDAVDFDTKDYVRAAALYGLLYIDKYTPLNPRYTAAFIAGLVREGLLEIKGLRAPNGHLDGIICFFDSGEVMTVPIIGYETSRPQSLGLYRMLMAVAFERSRARRMLFNASAGADGFKRNRGARPVLEYSAVYNLHLPPHRRAALRFLAMLLTRLAVPIAKRYLA